MAESSPSPAAAEGNPPQSELGSSQPDPSQPPASVPVSVNPSLTSPPPAILPSLQNPYAPPHLPVVAPPTAPSFRPATPPVPVPSAPQFSPLPVQPPGVGAMPSMSAPMMMPPYAQPGQQLNPPLRTPYASMPNGFPAMPLSAPQGTIPPPGIPRYPSPYNPMVRPAYPLRLPGAMGSIPPLLRPPIPGIRGPIIPPVIRPAAISSVTPTEKPQTTVYVGKIASTVENDFVLSLLQLCGSVKNWKRAQDPTNGTPKGFGFCEFESPEGVLRALRLLSKLNVDGQELLINVTQATKEYLERYVEKKAENSKKLKETENVGAEKEEEGAASSEKSEPPKPSDEESKKDDKDAGSEEKNDTASFGIVTDEDREADRVALEKLSGMIEERLKNNPLPPPPPLPAADGSSNLNLEQLAKSKDGDSDVDDIRNGEDKKDDEMASDGKPSSEQDRPETSSPDRTKRNDRRSRDKERDLKREKERELERYEREREQERNRREREREYKLKEDDRRYKARVKEWESREREKEYLRKLDKEKEKEREYKRKREIMEQEHEGDDGDSKRRKHKSGGSEERKRRLREKEEDLADRLKEDEEVAEAKRRSDEELRQLKEREKDALEPLPGSETNASDKAELLNQTNVESKDKAVELTYDGDSGNVNHSGNGILQNGNGDESVMEAISASDMQQNNNISAKKLGFGLVGSGKRTTVPSVFNQEEDEDAHKDKKMRPLVPIDYSTEELQAVQSSISGAPSSNLAAAAEFAKRISGATSKEDRPDAERERSRRSHDRSSHRDRIGDDTNRTRDDSRKETFERDRDRDQKLDKLKTPDNKKLLDAKQLIDMIPKTKEELFSYEINWAIYDKNELHDRMRPWISKKITEFLGEEEPTLVDYIVSSTQEHVVAAEMLERLQSILDDEAEMFVLKMWRMLIFEIKKIETGLAVRSKS